MKILDVCNFLAHVRCSVNVSSSPFSQVKGNSRSSVQAAGTPEATTRGPDLQARAVTPTGPGVISPWSSRSLECRRDLHSHRDNSKLD